ncbi:PREDICTED: FAS-associated factor 1-like [Cyprinodon variegatus]|uniref:FAS-associated factor 1-like n=1 Tax=Cyprinodon variegatus TaxID=28743 RepID=UPI0007425A46|nr:PREDICTED: FAS-associated factor 1-like [Cyprinodon variegatus]
MTLALSGISYPCHRLSVCRRSSPANAQEPTDECTDVHMISDSEGDDYEDASEFGVDDSEMFGMTSSSCRKSPMMPENSENEADALLYFTAEFSSRYGETHPMFYIGSLEAASQEAFYGKARDVLVLMDRSLLLVVAPASQMMMEEVRMDSVMEK